MNWILSHKPTHHTEDELKRGELLSSRTNFLIIFQWTLTMFCCLPRMSCITWQPKNARHRWKTGKIFIVFMVTKDGQQKTLIRRCEVVKLNYELRSSSSSVSNFKILERYGKSSVEIEFHYYSFSANNDDTWQNLLVLLTSPSTIRRS